MELKVWVEGIQRVVCGASYSTSCQDVVLALAHAMGRTGRFTLVERWRDSERPLAPVEKPLEALHKWGEYATEVRFFLVQAEGSTNKVSGDNTFRESKTNVDVKIMSYNNSKKNNNNNNNKYNNKKNDKGDSGEGRTNAWTRHFPSKFLDRPGGSMLQDSRTPSRPTVDMFFTSSSPSSSSRGRIPFTTQRPYTAGENQQIQPEQLKRSSTFSGAHNFVLQELPPPSFISPSSSSTPTNAHDTLHQTHLTSPQSNRQHYSPSLPPSRHHQYSSLHEQVLNARSLSLKQANDNCRPATTLSETTVIGNGSEDVNDYRSSLCQSSDSIDVSLTRDCSESHPANSPLSRRSFSFPSQLSHRKVNTAMTDQGHCKVQRLPRREKRQPSWTTQSHHMHFTDQPHPGESAPNCVSYRDSSCHRNQHSSPTSSVPLSRFQCLTTAAAPARLPTTACTRPHPAHTSHEEENMPFPEHEFAKQHQHQELTRRNNAQSPYRYERPLFRDRRRAEGLQDVDTKKTGSTSEELMASHTSGSIPFGNQSTKDVQVLPCTCRQRQQVDSQPCSCQRHLLHLDHQMSHSRCLQNNQGLIHDQPDKLLPLCETHLSQRDSDSTHWGVVIDSGQSEEFVHSAFKQQHQGFTHQDFSPVEVDNCGSADQECIAREGASSFSTAVANIRQSDDNTSNRSTLNVVKQKLGNVTLQSDSPPKDKQKSDNRHSIHHSFTFSNSEQHQQDIVTKTTDNQMFESILHISSSPPASKNVLFSSHQNSAFKEVSPKHKISSSASSTSFNFEMIRGKVEGWNHSAQAAGSSDGLALDTHSHHVCLEVEEYDLENYFPDEHQNDTDHTFFTGLEKSPHNDAHFDSGPLEYHLDGGRVRPAPYRAEAEYQQLSRLVTVQLNMIREIETKVSRADEEIATLETQTSCADLKLQELSFAGAELDMLEAKFCKEQTELDYVEWSNVLGGERIREADIKSQLGKIQSQLKAVEENLSQLKNHEGKKIKQVEHETKKQAQECKEKEKREKQSAAELDQLRQDLRHIDTRLEGQRRSLEMLEDEISRIEYHSKEQEFELETIQSVLKKGNLKDFYDHLLPKEPVPDVTVENHNFPTSGFKKARPYISSSSDGPDEDTDSAPDTGEAIIKILEGRLSPVSPLADELSKMAAIMSAQQTYKSALAAKNPNGVWV